MTDYERQRRLRERQSRVLGAQWSRHLAHQERERRRLMGRTAAQGVGVVALIVAGAWGCSALAAGDPPATALTYCATDPGPFADPVVVDDSRCPGGVPGPGLQLIEQTVPGNDASTFVVLATGDRVDHRDGAYRSVPRGTQVRAGAQSAQVVRQQTAASTGAPPGQRQTVTRSQTVARGGLGVTSGSSSGGSKGGSSGGSSGS